MRADAGPYRASQLAAACQGHIVGGDPDTLFAGISTDSRDIREADLFVPLKGANFDGHEFVLSALEAGARGCLVDRDTNREYPQYPANKVLIQVQDTLQTLADLASAHRLIYTLPLIAVTGSSGKTTVKEMIASILGRSHKLLASKGNFNNLIGLPMTVLNISSEHTAAVVEAGINTNGEMERLAHASRPNVVVITTIGPVHLEGLGSVENVAKEKFRLARALPEDGVAVLPADDPYLAPLLGECPGRIVSFGLGAGDYRAVDVRTAGEPQFRMVTPELDLEISLRISGSHNVLNALAAAAACISIGASAKDVVQGLADFRPPTWRMEKLALPRDRVLIRDCYNANPQSMKAALQALNESGSKTLALLGDMKELGESSVRLHEETGREAARLGVAMAVFVGGHAGDFARGFIAERRQAGDVFSAADKQEAWDTVRPMLDKFDAILVKGSRAMKMETLADLILEAV